MKQKCIIFLFLLVGGAWACYSQTPDSSSISIVSYWNNGDHEVYDGIYKKYKISGSDTTMDLAVRYQLDMLVVDSNQTSYKVDAKYSNHQVTNDNPVLKDVLEAVSDITLQIVLTDVGAYEDLLNWKEVSNYVEKPIEKLKQKYGLGQNKLIEGISNLYKTKEGIVGNCMNDLMALQYFHGLEYNVGKILEVDQKLKSNFSDTQLDVKVSIWCDSVMVDDGVAKMVKYVEFDKDQTNEEIKKFFTNSGIKITAKELSDLNLSITESTINYIDINTGWTVYSLYTKEVISNESKNIEEREMILR
jgi:hypothetical protein